MTDDVAVPQMEPNLFVARICAGVAPGHAEQQGRQLDQPAPADDGVDPAREEPGEAEQSDDLHPRVVHERVTSPSRRR